MIRRDSDQQHLCRRTASSGVGRDRHRSRGVYTFDVAAPPAAATSVRVSGDQATHSCLPHSIRERTAMDATSLRVVCGRGCRTLRETGRGVCLFAYSLASRPAALQGRAGPCRDARASGRCSRIHQGKRLSPRAVRHFQRPASTRPRGRNGVRQPAPPRGLQRAYSCDR